MDKPEPQINTPWWKPGLIIFIRISSWIAVPIIIAVYVGKYLDTTYNTSPWMFLISSGIAFVVSILGIWKNTSRYMNDIQNKK